MKFFNRLLLTGTLLFAADPAFAANQYISGLSAVGSVGLTDTFADCGLNACGSSTAAQRATTLQILDALSVTAPITFNTSTAVIGIGGPSNLTTFVAGAIPLGNGSSPFSALAAVNGDCVIGSGGVWTAGSCGGASGFPITIGSTSVAASSTTTTISGLALSSPTIATILNTGTLSLPTSTDTLVGRATTDTLTNKTLTSPTINAGALSGTLTGAPTFSGNVIFSGQPVFSGTLTGTQVSCLGISSGNVLVSSSGACGSGGGSVSLTSTSAALVATPSTITGTGSFALTNPINVQSGASYTFLSTDATKTVNMTSGSATTTALPVASTSGFTSGFSSGLQTEGAGSTLTATTSTINGIAGSTGIKIGAYQGTQIQSDSTNYQVALGLPQPSTQTGTTFLRDDMTWQTPAGSGNVSTSGSITTGSLGVWASGTGLAGTVVPGTGVLTFLATPSSANLAAAVTGETGTGALMFGTAPTMSSPTVTTAFTATGLVTNADLVNASTTVNGITCTLGSTCTVSGVGATTAGTANAQTLVKAGYTLTDQSVVNFKVGAGLTNTTAAPTLNVNSTGTTATDVQSGAALVSLPQGFLVAGLQYSATYQSSCTCFVVMTTPTGGVTIATTNQAPTSALWAVGQGYVLNAASLTVTPVVSTTLSPNGFVVVNAVNAGTIAATSPDVITSAAGTTGAGGSVSITAGCIATVSTNGAGVLYVAGNLCGGGGGGGLTVGTTTITSGTSGNVEFNNAGVLGEKGVTGTGSVALAASPTFTGVPLAPTASVGTNTTQLATTAFVLANATPSAPIALTWGAGQNLSTATVGMTLFTANVARTVTAISCRPDVVVGGTATLDVYLAASGTSFLSGTKITTTSCNANTGAATNQTGLLGSSTAVPAGSSIGIVAAGAGWASSTGFGAISVTVQ